MSLEAKKMTHSLHSAILNTETLFHQNLVIGCSAKGKQRNCTTRAVLMHRARKRLFAEDMVKRSKARYVTNYTYNNASFFPDVTHLINNTVNALSRFSFKGKGKVVPVLLTKHHAMKAYWGSGCIAPLVL
jgi:hypothetical protein